MTLRDDSKPQRNPINRFLLVVVLSSFLLGGLAVFLGFVVVIREQDRQKELRHKAAQNLRDLETELVDITPPEEYPPTRSIDSHLRSLPETQP